MTRFESLLEAVPDALVGMDQNGMIRFVNSQTESLFGYDRDDLVGQRIETLVPDHLWPIYAEHKEDYFADLRTRSSGLDLVLSGRHRDGTGFPVNISLSHIDTGDVLLAITAVRDVDTHLQAVELAQLTAAVVEYSDDAIIASTLEGMVTSWNPAAERMYGYSGEEIIGKYAGLLIPEDRAGESRANLASIRADRAVERLETTRVRKDGTVFPVSITVAPIRDEDGVIVGASAVHRDVTEQRRAFEVAERMAAIVESSADAIIGRTIDGIVTSWNAAAERMFGYASPEMIGKSVSLLIPQDRSEEMKIILASVRAGRHVDELETIRARKDGTVFPVSVTVSPIHGADGAIVGAAVICRDMTELEHAAQYARSLIEAGMDPMLTISPEGMITDANEAAVKVAGVPHDRLIGTAISLYHTEPEKTDEIYQLVVAQGSVADYPLTLRHRDGTLTDVLCNLSVFRDTGGEVLGVLATGRDVTKQKVAFETAQRMAAIIEYSDDAIISGSLDGTITSWNPAAERMYGYSAQEIIGRPARSLAQADRTQEIESVIARIRAGQHVVHLETRRVRKDGTVFPVSLTVSPIRNEGAITGTSVIHRDLTEQRQALAAAQRMAAIVEFSGEAIVSGTLEGIITSWNPAAERLYGYSSEEAVGKHVDLLSPQDRTGEIISVLARVRNGEVVESFETDRVRKDGTAFPVSITFAPNRDGDGAVVGVSSIHRDRGSPK
jgi:PAS domain S-box-containing protein